MEEIYAWTASGRRLHVDLSDERAHALVAADGDLNPLSTVLWQHVLAAHPWDLVVDVGVNYGEMLVGVDLPPRARVVGFEPNPVVRALAARTFADHGLDVDLRAEAVGAAVGTASFAVDPDWSGLSSFAVPGAPGEDVVEVAVTTLDEVTAGAGSVCVKVDVEGFEADVLAGATRLLSGEAPWALMLEVKHLPPGGLAHLARGHHVVLLAADGRSLVPATPGDAETLLASGTVYPQDAVLTGSPGRNGPSRPMIGATTSGTTGQSALRPGGGSGGTGGVAPR